MLIMDVNEQAQFKLQQYLLNKSVYRGCAQLVVPQTWGMAHIQTFDEKVMERIIESCLFKTVTTYVMCYGLGAAIGLFSASVGPVDTVQAQTQTFREVLKQMKTTTLWNARSFAKIGALFMIVECNVETYRGQSDWKNGTIAGGITGALIGLKSGLKSSVASAVGFAAFSTAIDYYLHWRQ